MGTSPSHHDKNNNKTVDFVDYDGQRNFATPSGPCMLCGRPSTFPSPLKEDAFECEFLCGWSVPHDIRERLRQVKEQEERRDAELHGYEADDEEEDGVHDTVEMTDSVTVDDSGLMGDEMDGFSSQTPPRNIADDRNREHHPAAGQDTGITSYHFGAEGGMVGSSSDTDDVDVYEEMHKTLFPDGTPWPPIPPTNPRGITNGAVGHDDLPLAASAKRKPQDGHKGNNDRPAKKQKIVGGPSTTVSRDPTDCFRLGARHSLMGRKTKPSLDDALFGFHDDELHAE